MLRRLILLRHGEAAWQSSTGTDEGRPLTASGREQATQIAGALSENGWIPDHVLTSPAVRARDTAHIVGSTYGCNVGERPVLYEGGLRDIQDHIIGGTGGSVSTLLLVGHNPTFSSLASALSGLRVSLGTANAALLTIDDTDWGRAALLDAGWHLASHLVPM